MSGIAHLVLSCGFKVSGSDLKESSATRELVKAGARIFIGHSGRNIKGTDLVIYSSAIKDDNPEVLEARKNNIPVIKRAEALAELMKQKNVITVAGSHGKTTTTSLVSYLLLEAGLFPTVAIGGILKNIDTNACLGKGDFFVAEADESDGSFLYYQPKYSILTNIDREHLDFYKDFDNEIKAFREFVNRTKEGGCLFCCDDDVYIKMILRDYKNKHISFGLSENADVYAKNIQLSGLSSDFDCFYQEKLVCRFHLALGGRHNVSNALSVIALGLELGIDLKVIRNTLENYKGARRRLEVKFSNEDYLVIDDYAHHPTEIQASLLALKSFQRKVIAVFQPHRYSRTKILLDDFVKSFDLADSVVITDIYPANEPAIPGVSATALYEKIKERSPDKEVYFSPKENIVGQILTIIKPGDLVVTLGAGDITRINDELVAGFTRQSLVR